MNRKIHILISFLALSAIGLPAQVILSPEERSDLLDGVDSVIENTSRPLVAIGEEESPFYKTQRKAPAPVVNTAVPVEKVEDLEDLPAILSDSMALEVISRQFKPLGSMVLGNRGFLQLPKGGTIEKGQKFNAQIKGVSYEVRISEVTQRGYTLELGTAEKEQTFLKAGAGQ